MLKTPYLHPVMWKKYAYHLVLLVSKFFIYNTTRHGHIPIEISYCCHKNTTIGYHEQGRS